MGPASSCTWHVHSESEQGQGSPRGHGSRQRSARARAPVLGLRDSSRRRWPRGRLGSQASPRLRDREPLHSRPGADGGDLRAPAGDPSPAAESSAPLPAPRRRSRDGRKRRRCSPRSRQQALVGRARGLRRGPRRRSRRRRHARLQSRLLPRRAPRYCAESATQGDSSARAARSRSERDSLPRRSFSAETALSASLGR